MHCQPGDICLRDDTVTHRCLTCAKNYRCELQTTNEMLDMANVEPWLGEERTYYQSEQPEADRANPFLEFDPQMCIICTRCVRACDEIRHTGAITLAGRGFETRIAFGAGGAIHESNCDFCGACIDVCPTATLLEKPNKWIAKTEDWVSTTCNCCSVGCTLSVGVRNGKIVMVKPDRLNPVSWDQICVRGRFHYDAIKTRERLTRHLVRQGDALMPASFDDAIAAAGSRLADVVKASGAGSVGFLVAPWATNEEAYLAQKLARERHRHAERRLYRRTGAGGSGCGSGGRLRDARPQLRPVAARRRFDHRRHRGRPGVQPQRRGAAGQGRGRPEQRAAHRREQPLR